MLQTYFNGNELKYVEETLHSNFSASSCGTMNERLEESFAEKMGKEYAITVNSGTSALHMALYALGVCKNDEVLVPALTVGMCGFAVRHCGATPVYVDVEQDTFLMDADDLKRKITKKTKAIMVVHLYGLMCNMNEIVDAANGVPIVEDCCQCFLAKDSYGRISGTIGDIGCWSFENSKHMSTGDGGIVVTDSKLLATKMRQFGGVGFSNLTAKSGKVRISRDKFQDPNWKRHNIIGYNYRLPEICAAVGLAQLETLDENVSLRRKMGNTYRRVIEESNFDILIPQAIPEKYKHVYYTFAALFDGQKYGISWKEFRKKYVSFGGDGIYAAWQTVNNEPAFDEIGWGEVKVAEELQKNMMQFTTNQRTALEINIQAEAMKKILQYYAI